MDREERMKMMREKPRGKEYERFTLLKGDNLAACIAGLIGIALIIVKLVAGHKFDFGICAVVFAVTSIQSLNEGIKLRKWWLIVGGIITGLVSLIMIILFLAEVFIK